MKWLLSLSLGKWVLFLLLLTLAFIALGALFIRVGLLQLAGFFWGCAILSGALFCWCLWKYIEVNKITRSAFVFVGRIIGGIAKFIANIAKGLGLKLGFIVSKMKPPSALHITLFKDEKSSLHHSSSEKKRVSPYKRMKWKHLTTDADRVRYVYYFFMRKKIRKGYPYVPAETPTEIRHNLQPETAAFPESELFDMYNVHRYNHAATSENVEKLKSFI